MPNLISLDQVENIFTAKCNVKHTTGGPTMALVGFIHPIAMKIFENIGEDLTTEQQLYLSEKIIIDKEKGIGFFTGIAGKTFYGHIFNQNGKLGGWYSPGHYASKFLCVTRFFDDSKGIFVYKIFNANELVLN